MIRCRECGKPIEQRQKIVVQYEAVMQYQAREANPTATGRHTIYWHKKCKPWQA